MSIFKNQGYLTITLDTGVALASAIVVRIKYQNPKRVAGYFEGTVTELTKVTYQFQNEDLNIRGLWRFQAYVVIGGLNAFGDIVEYDVKNTL